MTRGNNEGRARTLAEAFRTERRLGVTPIKDLFEMAHTTLGIDVLSLAAGESEHGLTMLDPATGRRVIAVATTRHPMRQRSSIAHEIGHVLAGDLDDEAVLVPGERSPQEIRADAFARHLLLPLAALTPRFVRGGDHPTTAQLSDLVQEFEVSPRVAAIQLKQAGIIDPTRCEQWGTLTAGRLAMTYGWDSQYRSLVADSQSPRAPQGLMIRAVTAYHRGLLDVREIALWYGQPEADVASELGPPNDTPPTQDLGWDIDEPLFDDEGTAS